MTFTRPDPIRKKPENNNVKTRQNAKISKNSAVLSRIGLELLRG